MRERWSKSRKENGRKSRKKCGRISRERSREEVCKGRRRGSLMEGRKKCKNDLVQQKR